MSQFEPFANKNYVGKNTLDGYSITYRKAAKNNKYISTQINFGGGMDKLFRGYKNIRTFVDKEKGLVAVQPNNDPRDDYNRALRRNNKRYFMTSNSFIKMMVEDLCYPPSLKLGYELYGKLIILKKTTQTTNQEGEN